MEIHVSNGNHFDVSRQTIYLFGEIDDHTAHNVVFGLSQMDPTKGVNLILSTPGGSEEAAWSIISAMLMYPGYITVTAYGQAMSMGVAILQAADNRVLAPYCDLLIHQGSMQISSDNIQQGSIVDIAKQIERGNERYYRIIAERSGQSMEQLAAWGKGETFFSAEEAVAAGLADVVLKPVKVFNPSPKRKPRKKTT